MSDLLISVIFGALQDNRHKLENDRSITSLMHHRIIPLGKYLNNVSEYVR